MKTFISPQIVKAIKKNSIKNDFEAKSFAFIWPSFLECIEEGDLFKNLTAFDEMSPLYKACFSTLNTHDEIEVVHYVFDRLFQEVLGHIKNLNVIRCEHLIKRIRLAEEQYPIFSSALEPFYKDLTEKGALVTHDLILYLAWDRVCAYLARLFDCQTENIRYLNSIAHLKHCLFESYQHIKMDGKSCPGFWPVVEALFFYQMREENLQKHSKEEWDLLNKGFQVLKNADELSDISYVDLEIKMDDSKEKAIHLTLEPASLVSTRILLAEHMLKKIKEEMPSWAFKLNPANIKPLSF